VLVRRSRGEVLLPPFVIVRLAELNGEVLGDTDGDFPFPFGSTKAPSMPELNRETLLSFGLVGGWAEGVIACEFLLDISFVML